MGKVQPHVPHASGNESLTITAGTGTEVHHRCALFLLQLCDEGVADRHPSASDRTAEASTRLLLVVRTEVVPDGAHAPSLALPRSECCGFAGYGTKTTRPTISPLRS